MTQRFSGLLPQRVAELGRGAQSRHELVVGCEVAALDRADDPDPSARVPLSVNVVAPRRSQVMSWVEPGSTGETRSG